MNKDFDIDLNNIHLQTTAYTNKYLLNTTKYNQKECLNISINERYVCVLPFEVDADDNITLLYLLKYFDFIKKDVKYSTILESFDDKVDNSNLDATLRSVNLKLNLKIKEIDKVFYIGSIELNQLISGEIPCYAVNVTKMIKKKEKIFNIINKDFEVVEKVRYRDVLKSGTSDYLVGSATFLLLSYFS